MYIVAFFDVEIFQCLRLQTTPWSWLPVFVPLTLRGNHDVTCLACVCITVTELRFEVLHCQASRPWSYKTNIIFNCLQTQNAKLRLKVKKRYDPFGVSMLYMTRMAMALISRSLWYTTCELLGKKTFACNIRGATPNQIIDPDSFFYYDVYTCLPSYPLVPPSYSLPPTKRRRQASRIDWSAGARSKQPPKCAIIVSKANTSWWEEDVGMAVAIRRNMMM